MSNLISDSERIIIGKKMLRRIFTIIKVWSKMVMDTITQ
jgi:hypothetical protein